MNTEQILKVLKNERECIARQSRPLGKMPQCRKDEDGVKLCEYCDLCLPDTEILEVYDFLINGYEMLQDKGAESYTIKCKEPLTDFELGYLTDQLRSTTITADIQPVPDNLRAIILGEDTNFENIGLNREQSGQEV